MTLEAIIFDFDGTLAELTIDFDLLKHKIAALYEALADERPEPPHVPALEWLDVLASDLEQARGRELALEFHSRGRLVIQATELDAAKAGKLFPFTRDLLATLRRKGVGTGIITRNSTAAVRTVFPGIESHCDVFLAREDVARTKPHPDHLLAALQRLGAAPERSLMVGDHTMDLDTGKNAGSMTAGVASGNLDAATLARGGADLVAENADALMRLLADRNLLS